MPRRICYSQISHPTPNLTQSIKLKLSLPGTLEYYFASVSTTLQKITQELDNMTKSISYTLFLSFSENVTENNKDIFLFEDLPSSSD